MEENLSGQSTNNYTDILAYEARDYRYGRVTQ